MNEKILINKLPVRTWNRLGVNETEIERNCEGAALPSAEALTAPAGGAPIRLDITDGNSQKELYIAARENSHLTIFECCTSRTQLGVKFMIDIGKDASVRLVQLLNPNSGSVLRHEIFADCAKNGSFELLSVMVGSGNIYSDTHTELKGDKSRFSSETAYLVRGSDTVDFNIVSNHCGTATESKINACGAVADSGQKIFRGTIDFKNGSTDSVGCENETVLMLGENAVNKTVPLILCAEENVEGTHGATIGELDADTLFYFESRGIPKSAAERIMARAAADRIIGMANDETFASAASKALDAALENIDNGRAKQ